MDEANTLLQLESAVSAYRRAEEWRVRLERGFSIDELKIRIGGKVEDVVLTSVLVENIRSAMLADANANSALKREEMQALVKEVREP